MYPKINKVRPTACIRHSEGNDGWDARDYISYQCPTCNKRIGTDDIACDNCGTFFDWSKHARIEIEKVVVWE